MASRTSNYYKQNPEARKRRLKQQAKYNKTTEGMKIRTKANKLNRELGTYGNGCLLYTSPSPRDGLLSRMPSSA